MQSFLNALERERCLFFRRYLSSNKKARVSLFSSLKFRTRCDQKVRKTTATTTTRKDKTSCLMMYQRSFSNVLYIKVLIFSPRLALIIPLIFIFILAKIICERWKFWSGTVPTDVSVSFNEEILMVIRSDV